MHANRIRLCSVWPLILIPPPRPAPPRHADSELAGSAQVHLFPRENTFEITAPCSLPYSHADMHTDAHGQQSADHVHLLPA